MSPSKSGGYARMGHVSRGWSGPRSEGRRRIIALVQAPKLLIVLVGVPIVMTGIAIGMYEFETAVGYHWDEGVLGFVLGFAVASYLGAIFYLLAVYSGAATFLTGASAESWTDKELVALGSEWHIFRNVPFLVESERETYELDIDHIAIGPQGVLVVETKYSSASFNLDASTPDKYFRRAFQQAHLNSDRI